MKFIADPLAVSWVDYDVDCPFPLQNLPFGAMFDPNSKHEIVPVSAIGDYVVNLRALANAGLLPFEELNTGDALNPLLAAGAERISEVREKLYKLLHEDTHMLQDDHDLQALAFWDINEVHLAIPCRIPGYVDFYSGIHHASNVGKMFRPDQPPLLPNYRWIPIGYNGRASSVVVSGTPIHRPNGQMKNPNEEAPTFGPIQELDFELELGYFVAGQTNLGDSISVDEAENFIAGLCLVNDWSARDLQRWEYQPLGPFLAKTFGTSVSPWIVTLDALDPFRIGGMTQEPAPLAYLQGSGQHQFDIQLEVWLQTPAMTQPQLICASNTSNLYWSIAQQLAHQTSNGTNLSPGDLYATGTISGETENSFGSLLELTWRGSRPLEMAETGEKRTFLEDGDTVTMKAYAQGEGYRIGFGEVTGEIKAT